MKCCSPRKYFRILPLNNVNVAHEYAAEMETVFESETSGIVKIGKVVYVLFLYTNIDMFIVT